ncbi:MAG: hypothetical protein AAFZ07_20315 [Actinomycetota bacterium]
MGVELAAGMLLGFALERRRRFVAVLSLTLALVAALSVAAHLNQGGPDARAVQKTR